jgi:protein TonB
MEMGKILSADVLDIIFDQRNKEYGAYDLRKNYQRRLTKSLSVTMLVVVLVCLTYILLGSMKSDSGKEVLVHDLALEKIIEKEKPAEKIPIPPQKIIPPQEIKMLKSTPPIIVKGEVPDDEKPPLNDDLDNAKIGTVNTDGKDDIGIVAPVEEGKAVVAVPEKHDNGDETFRKVEIDARYPGGMEAWRAFLFRRLVYPQEAADEKIQGTVYVQFIVDREGNVSDVNAISGPPELYAAAVSVIKKSGKWEPGIQNGQKVKSYKNQPLTFKLNDDQ